jgi:hypothetical protein
VALKLTKPGLGSREVLAAHAAMLAAYGSDSPRTAGTASSLVSLYEAWGRLAEAGRYRSS